MSLREINQQTHPEFPWLAAGDTAAVESLLRKLHWLRAGETIQSCDRAGEGNMNLVLRVCTDQRTFILKQARPWVEKYDHIAAPWDRILVEQRFYERVAGIHAVAIRMPRVVASDADARVIVLEDLGEAADFTHLYRGELVEEDYLRSLATYLRRLHDVTAQDTPDPVLLNHDMRALNQQHIFEIPLQPNNGVELDKYELWLHDKAAELRHDGEFQSAVEELGERYLQDGRSLVHGDYFPGSWLHVGDDIKVIDPEFAFYGDPEFDIGVALAHLRLAAQNFDYGKLFLAAYTARDMDPKFDLELVARYAAVEVMRRILGVAQLPIPPTEGFRATALEGAREAMLGRSVEALWA
jgi:5-methylthioribose kinase